MERGAWSWLQGVAALAVLGAGVYVRFGWEAEAWIGWLVLLGCVLVAAWLLRGLARAALWVQDDGQERVMLYDGDCGFCRRWMRWARRHPAGIRYEACQSQAELRSRAGIADGLCTQASFLVLVRQGVPVRVLAGAAAVNAALRRFQGPRNVGWRALGSLYGVPGIRQLENVSYRWVARNRHRFGSASCSVDEMRRRDPL